MSIVPKKWGYETHLVNNDLYCGKILTVLPNGMACSIHYHENKKETFYVLRGSLVLEVYNYNPADGFSSLKEMLTLKTGDSVTLDPLTPHRFYVTNGEVAEFIEVSTHDDPLDSYRLVESGPIS